MNKEEAIDFISNLEINHNEKLEKPNPYVIDMIKGIIHILYNSYFITNFNISLEDGYVNFVLSENKSVSFFNDGKIHYRNNNETFISEDFSYLKQFLE